MTVSVEGSILEPVSANQFDAIVARTQQQHRLFSVHWELTYRCNERCSHCYLDVLPAHARVPDELTTAECLRVVDELAALGALNLTFSGGEIFTRRDFFDIAEYARARKFLLRLFTNGIAITPALADRVAALHPFAVEISVYGASAETHDKITRRAGSFELTTRALRFLRGGVRTVMKTVVMRDNVCEFDALKMLAEELGAQFRYDITVTPKDNGDQSPLQHSLTDDDQLRLLRATLDPRSWPRQTMLPDKGTCGVGMNALLIDPYGNVFPCVHVRVAAGNVREQSLGSIWTESPLWQDLSRLTLDNLPGCRTCALNKFCVRCHGLAHLEHNDLRAPARINCREASLRRRVLAELNGV